MSLTGFISTHRRYLPLFISTLPFSHPIVPPNTSIMQTPLAACMLLGRRDRNIVLRGAEVPGHYRGKARFCGDLASDLCRSANSRLVHSEVTARRQQTLVSRHTRSLCSLM